MSLKRKASFPTIASTDQAQPITIQPMMDDNLRHLNSRTRKRIRNGRPDDQVVYENTLRWLFTAQQRQQEVQTPPANEDEDMQTEPAETVIDPRQRTLLQFFRPTRTSLLPAQPNHPTQIPKDSPQASADHPEYRYLNVISPHTPVDSGTGHTSSQMFDGDTEMEMDLQNDGLEQECNQWFGTLSGYDVLVKA